MITQLWWQGRRPHGIIIFMMIMGLSLLPVRSGHQIMRFHAKALLIQTSKTSPPRLAFNESVDRQKSEAAAWMDESKTGSSRVNLNDMMRTSSRLNRGLQAIRYKKVVLAPLVIPRQVEASPSRPSMDETDWISELSPGQRDRLQLAQEKSRVLDESWKIPTTRDLLEEKINEISSQTSTVTNAGIYIAARDPNTGKDRTPAQVWKDVGVRVAPRPEEPSPIEGGDRSMKGLTQGTTVMGDITVDPESAVGTGRHVEVHYEHEGVPQSTGQVTLDRKQASYRIEIPAKEGKVIARVVDTSGSVVGSGEYRITQRDTPKTLAMAAIHIEPRDHISRTARNFYDPDRPRFASLKNSKRGPSPRALVGAFGEEVAADTDSQVRVEGLAQGSWTFLRTEEKGFYPGLHLATTGPDKPLILYPEKMMQALLQIVRAQRGSGLGGEPGSVIWGRIVQGENGLGGAEVVIEGLPDARPVYFNDLLIPDEKTSSTGGNGYFAFVDLPQGFYSLRATQGERLLGISNTEVDDQTVSSVEIKSDSLNEKVSVKVFDAFTGTAGVARLEFQNLQNALEIEGYASVEIPHQENLYMIQVTPQDASYFPTRQMASATQDHLHIPLLRQDWLESLRGAFRISERPQSGVILGFVPSDDYEVNLPHLSASEDVQILYFNSQGQPVEQGAAGGGFVVFNTPPGVHAVSLLPKNQNRIHSRVVSVDPGTVNVLKFDF